MEYVKKYALDMQDIDKSPGPTKSLRVFQSELFSVAKVEQVKIDNLFFLLIYTMKLF